LHQTLQPVSPGPLFFVFDVSVTTSPRYPLLRDLVKLLMTRSGCAVNEKARLRFCVTGEVVYVLRLYEPPAASPLTEPRT